MSGSAFGSQTLGVAVVIVALLMAPRRVSARRAKREYPAPAVDEESLYLTSGTPLRRLSAGYSALAADLYWIRAIQYYGGTKLHLAAQPSRPTSRRSPSDGITSCCIRCST